MKIKINQIILLAILFTLTISKASAGINDELIECCKSGNLECVKALVEKGADVNAEVYEYKTNEYGPDTLIYRPLSVAVDKGNALLAEYLLKKGANPNTTNEYGGTMLVNCNIELFKLLIKYGAKDNWNLLLCYAARDDFEKTEMLLKLGANVNCIMPEEECDVIFHTPLQNAVRGDLFHQVDLDLKIRLISLLLKYKANVNLKDNNGSNALNYAVDLSSDMAIAVLTLLIKNGANKESINNALLSSTHFVGGDIELVRKLLIKAGANRAVLVESMQRQWWYCDNSYNCINKMRITFENNSFAPISSVTFMLTIKSGSGSVLYKKKHTAQCSIDHDESAPCKEFMLAEKVWDYDSGFGDGNNISIDVEVLSVK